MRKFKKTFKFYKYFDLINKMSINGLINFIIIIKIMRDLYYSNIIISIFNKLRISTNKYFKAYKILIKNAFTLKIFFF